MIDNYPSRKTNVFKILKRECPVSLINSTYRISVYDHNKYQKNGYLIYKNIVPIRLIDNAKNFISQVKNNNSLAYIVNEKNDSRIRSILDIEKDLPTLCHYAKKFAEDILGPCYVHQSRINLKSGIDSAGWSIHSDFETWHTKDGMPNMNCLSVLIPLDVNNENNGCLHVLKKSHKYYISCPKINTTDPVNEFAEQTEGVPNNTILNDLYKLDNIEDVSIECNPGDLILFDCNLLHYSNVSKSLESRNNLYFVFNSVNNKLLNPYSGDLPRPLQMAKR